MLQPWRKVVPRRRNAGGVLRCLACIWLSCTGVACSAFIDQELSGKGEGAGGAGGSGGTGGSASGGSGGQATTTTSTSTSTTTSVTTTSATASECTVTLDCYLPHAIPKCSDGVCELDKCHLYFGNCNGDRLDGCESELWHDDAHCGKCEIECDDGKECEGGKCK